jgi:hypothetical protein
MYYLVALFILSSSIICAQNEYGVIELDYVCFTDYFSEDLLLLDQLYSEDNQEFLSVSIMGKDSLLLIGMGSHGDTIFIHSEWDGRTEVYFPELSRVLDVPSSPPKWKILKEMEGGEIIGGFTSTVFFATAENMTSEVWLSNTLFNVNMIEGSMRSDYFRGGRLMLKSVGRSTVERSFKSETTCELTGATFR